MKPPRHLTVSEQNERHPANQLWLLVALLRLQLRQGPKQTSLLEKKA